MDLDHILKQLKQFKMNQVDHLDGSLLDHCLGVFHILKSWGARPELQLAGLCHSIYGTEEFRRQTISFTKRGKVSKIIGAKAEALAYLFCVMKRSSLWKNLDRSSEFYVQSHLDLESIPLSEQDVRDLLTLLLANSLEQRPRELLHAKSWDIGHYKRAERFLPPPAFNQFLEDFGIKRNGQKKVLVIGGTLYIGKRTVLNLLAEGYSVTILSRGIRPDFHGNNVDRIFVDRHNPQEFQAALASTRWHAVFDHLCYTAQHALSACNVFSEKTDYYLMLSSQSVYSSTGTLTENSFDPIAYQWSETDDIKSLTLHDGRTYTGSLIPRWLSPVEHKRRAEATIAQNMHSPFCIARIPMVLGSDDPNRRLLTVVQKTISGERWDVHSSSEGKFSVAHVDDIAKATFFAFEKRVTGVLNCAARGSLTTRALMRAIRKELQISPLLARSKTPRSPSPFSKLEDQILDIQRAESFGIKSRRINEWLPDLILDTAKELLKDDPLAA